MLSTVASKFPVESCFRKISGPAGDPVGASRMAGFHSVRDQLLADLRGGQLSIADEAL